MNPEKNKDEWPQKLQSLRDLEVLAEDAVKQGHLTASEAEEAITDYITWLERDA